MPSPEFILSSELNLNNYGFVVGLPANACRYIVGTSVFTNVDPVLVCNPAPAWRSEFGGARICKVFCLDPLNNLELSFHLIEYCWGFLLRSGIEFPFDLVLLGLPFEIWN